jgi:NDP-sugar pyrophosphorylase family protein
MRVLGSSDRAPALALLGGGLATRLRPPTLAAPKSLVEIAGEPFIAHQLQLLASQGIGDIVVCAGHLGEQITEYVGDGAFDLADFYRDRARRGRLAGLEVAERFYENGSPHGLGEIDAFLQELKGKGS